MEKIGLIFRKTLEGRIQKELKEASGTFIVKYSKLSSPDLTLLRQSLRGSNAGLFVAKNSIVRRVLINSKLENMVKFLEGPCGLVFARNEPVDASRALYKFSREHENLKLECGVLKDRFLEKKDIEALANLASKEVLRAQVVMTLKSPISGIVYVLKQTLRKSVYCIEQIRQKKYTINKSPQ